MESKEKPIINIEGSSRREPKVSFFSGIKEELKKISWTTKAELFFFTKVVVIATFAFGMGIYMIDLIVKGGLEATGYIVHLIFG